MKRLEEAKSLLSNTSTSSTGLSAMSLWFVDSPKAIEGYNSIFEGQSSDGGLPSSGVLHGKGMIAHFLYNIYLSAPDDATVLSFLKSIFPKVLSYHEYVCKQFGEEENGLIAKEGVVEPLINSTYIWSCAALIELGYELDLPSGDLFEQNELAIHAMNELLWDAEAGIYHGYDMKQEILVENHTATGFMPMCAGVPDIDQILSMVHRAFGVDFRLEGHYSIPSVKLNAPEMDYTAPDQGAISIKHNWLLVQGLERYDMDDLAEIIKEDTLHLLNEYGFHNHFDPRKSSLSNGIGDQLSSTAAAIYLDLLSED